VTNELGFRAHDSALLSAVKPVLLLFSSPQESDLAAGSVDSSTAETAATARPAPAAHGTPKLAASAGGVLVSSLRSRPCCKLLLVLWSQRHCITSSK